MSILFRSSRVLCLVVACIVCCDDLRASTLEEYSQISQSDTTVVSRLLPDSLAGQAFDSTAIKLRDTLEVDYVVGTSQIDWGRFAIATGSLAGAVTALHIYQANAWWSDQRGAFHLYDDPTYKDNFDKAGHGFGAFYSAHFFDEAFSWGGFNKLQSAGLASICAAFWEMYIEVEDGFARDWGFSRGDAIANVSGAGFYFLRSQVPYMDNLNYKWMYWPSPQMLGNRPDIPGQTQTFIEDYAGQSFWLTVNVHGMLPKSVQPYWPSWLNLAVGVADYSLGDPVIDNRRKAWMLSLDYDVGSLIPESDSPFLNFIRRSLNYWHFPAPAFRLSPEPRFFVLFPFRMTIG